MDPWLWDPPIYEDEDNFSLGEERQPDFCFWQEPDPIENDAANEKACIHVLRILIKKADEDITELEEDIILLRSQLAWTDESWSELCFVALREKIKFIEMSIKRLKNENQQEDQQEVDVHSQVHGEPGETIHDILKRLLEKYTQDKDEQHKSSNVENLGISQCKDETRLINSVAEVCGAKTSSQATTPLSLEAQKGDEGQHDGQNKQNRDTIIPGQLTDISSAASDEPNQWDLDKIKAESNRNQETSDHVLIIKDANTPENDEHAIAALRNPSGLISSFEAESNSREWGSNYSEGISTDVKVPSFTNECTILNSLTKSKEPILEELHKLADMIDSPPDAVQQLPQNTLMKQPMEEEEDADEADRIDLKSQLLTMENIGMRSPEWQKIDEWLNEGESLREMLIEKTENTEEEAIPTYQMLEQLHNTEVTVPEACGSNLLHRQELEQKPCFKLESSQPAQQPCLAVEMQSGPSSMKNLQDWESLIKDKHDSNTSANRNSTGQTLLDFRRDRSPSTAPDAGVTSDSQSKKKQKHSSISQVIKENKESGNIQTTSGMDKDTAHGMLQKDHPMSTCDTKYETLMGKHLESLSGSASMDHDAVPALEVLPMDTLRKLAKVNNLTGYSKLRKAELVMLLKARYGEGDWHGI